MLRMKIKDTVDVNTLLISGGIFSKIANTTDQPFEWLTSEDALILDNNYYLGHSGEKKISPYLRNLIQLEKDEKIDDYLSSLANYLILRFKDKWNKVHKAYIESDYKPLNNYDMDELRTPNLKDTEIIDIDRDNEEKQKTDLTTSTDTDNSADVYGFNSQNPVPSAKATGNNDTTVTGELDDNKVVSHGEEKGSRDTSHTGTETLHREGNIGVTTSQQMLQSELELRKYNFYEEIMKDVDSVLTLSVY